MRTPRLTALILTAGALAAPAHAQVVQDRYGPPPAHGGRGPGAAPAPAADYAGPMLGWANKTSARTVGAAAPAAPERPQALALAHQFVRTPQAQAQAPAPAPLRPAVQPGYEPVARAQIGPAAPSPAESPALLGGPPAQPLPQSLYGPAPSAAPVPAQQVATATGGGRTHLYSVHRPYGLTPDAIPAPPAGDRYVLVGPPDAPPPSEEAADDAEGLDRQF